MPQILATKLHIPPTRGKAVARPRLYQRLSEGLTRPLTLVSAPAGFGKSTLISEWYEQSLRYLPGAFPFAWVSLDREDNDPERFLAYLAAALNQIQAGAGERVLAVLDSPQPPSPRAILGLLLGGLAGFTGEGALVLDDYHTITNAEIHDLVSYLIGNLPPGLHMILATRADPPLPLGRLRVNDRLVEVRAADLLFRPEEAETFLSHTMGLLLSKEAISELSARTEGWAAGLQLAALAARSEGGEARGLMRGSGFGGEHPYLLDYLLEEVLDRLPAEQQAFLLRTSLLEELCGSLCNAVIWGDGVMSGQDSTLTLEALFRANLFLIPLGADAHGRQWFRYHHLFSESLSARLKQLDQALVPKIYERAARWYAGEGRMEEAIRCALAGGMIDQAALWIEEAAPLYLKNGRAAPVRRWLNGLSEDFLHSRPRMAIIWARTLFMTGDFAQARTELDRLEQRFLASADPQSTTPPWSAMLGEIYALRATIASMRGDWISTIADAQKGLELLPAENVSWRAVAALNLGNAQLISGQYGAGDKAFQTAIRDGLLADNLHVVFTAIANQSETRFIRGELREGASVLQRGLQIIHERAADAPAAAVPTASLIYCSLGELSIEHHDLSAAEGYIRQAFDLASQGGYVLAVISALAARAHLELARGTPKQGLAWIEQALKTVQGPQAQGLLGQLKVLQVRLQLALGDTASVERWAEGIDLEPGVEIDYVREIEAIMVMRLYRARGQAQRGLELAARLLAAAEAGQRLGRALEIRLQLALLYHQLGDRSAALAALREALNFAAPQGYCAVFLEAGEEMRPLLQSLLREYTLDDPLRDAARRILAAFSPGGDEPVSPNQQLVEPLSEREQEVLRMVAQGASNQAIADRLVLSLGTVKSHVHHIQGKLGTRSRVELVQRARDFGLI